MGQEKRGPSNALGVAFRMTSGLMFPRDLRWSGVLLHLRESSSTPRGRIPTSLDESEFYPQTEALVGSREALHLPT